MPRMAAILALAFAVPAWGAAPAAAPVESASDPAAVTVDLGGRAIEVSGPADWVEITARRELVRKSVEASVPAGSRHLATFAPLDDVARVDRGEEMSQWASFLAVKPFDTLDMADADFRELQAVMRAQWETIFESARKRMGTELGKSSERITEEIDVAVDVSMDDFTTGGMFLDEPGAIGAIMILEGDMAVAGESTAMKIAMAMMFVHVRSRAVVASVYHDYRSDADLASLKSAAMAWKDAVRAANSAGDVAP